MMTIKNPITLVESGITPSGNIDIVSAGVQDVSQYATATPILQAKEATPNATEQLITPDIGQVGLSYVTVHATPLQEGNAPSSAEEDTFYPDEDYVGFSSFHVSAVNLEEKQEAITANGTYAITPGGGYLGLKAVSLTINVPSESTPTQEKAITVTSNGVQTIEPDTGYALSKVTVTTNVPTSGSDAYKLFSNTPNLIVEESELVGITEIRPYGMYRFDNLTRITFPDTLTSIGAYAFQRSSGGANLTTFVFKSVVPPTLASSSCFANSYVNAIYVPDTSVDAYKGASNWSSLSGKIFPISELPSV